VGPQGLGLLRSAPAVGALCVGLFLSRRAIVSGVGKKLLIAVAIYGVSIVGFGLSRWFPVSLFLLAISGGADTISVVVRQTLIQLETPDRMRGRVAAVNTLFIGASNQLGEFESGVSATALGVIGSVVVGGLATILVSLAWSRLFKPLARRDALHCYLEKVTVSVPRCLERRARYYRFRQGPLMSDRTTSLRPLICNWLGQVDNVRVQSILRVRERCHGTPSVSKSCGPRRHSRLFLPSWRWLLVRLHTRYLRADDEASLKQGSERWSVAAFSAISTHVLNLLCTGVPARPAMMFSFARPHERRRAFDATRNVFPAVLSETSGISLLAMYPVCSCAYMADLDSWYLP